MANRVRLSQSVAWQAVGLGNFLRRLSTLGNVLLRHWSLRAFRSSDQDGRPSGDPAIFQLSEVSEQNSKVVPGSVGSYRSVIGRQAELEGTTTSCQGESAPGSRHGSTPLEQGDTKTMKTDKKGAANASRLDRLALQEPDYDALVWAAL